MFTYRSSISTGYPTAGPPERMPMALQAEGACLKLWGSLPHLLLGKPYHLKPSASNSFSLQPLISSTCRSKSTTCEHCGAERCLHTGDD